MRKLLAALAAWVVPVTVAHSAELEGVILRVNPADMTITMNNGMQVRVAAGLDFSRLAPGMTVRFILDDFNAVDSFDVLRSTPPTEQPS